MKFLSKLALVFSTCAILGQDVRAQNRSMERVDFSVDFHGVVPHQVASVSDSATVSIYNGARGVRQKLNDGSVYYVNYKQRFFSKGGFKTDGLTGKWVWWQSTREMNDVSDARDLAKIKELRAFLPLREVPCPQF